jgi:hypothetical protein
MLLSKFLCWGSFLLSSEDAALIPRRVRHAPHCSSTRSGQTAQTLCLLRFPDSFPAGEYVASVPLDVAGPFAV